MNELFLKNEFEQEIAYTLRAYTLRAYTLRAYTLRA